MPRPVARTSWPGLQVFMNARAGHEALGIGDNPAVAPDLFRRAAYEAAVSSSPSPAGRSRADFLAGLACEAATDRNRKDVIQDTALRTMQGTGHQHFLKTMREAFGNAPPPTVSQGACSHPGPAGTSISRCAGIPRRTVDTPCGGALPPER